MSLYLIINIASIAIPFAYSFEGKMYFIKWWKEVFASIFIVGFFFIIWDVIFTHYGIWGFNEKYLIGFNLINLPIEEWLFFVCIPYASIFTHYAFQYFFPKIRLSEKVTKTITIVLLIFSITIALYNYEKVYTFYNLLFLSLILMYSLITKEPSLNVFYLSFLIILFPFFIVNGLLTGSLIQESVVWYDNAENLGIRLGTIPIEDIGYAFNLLLLNIIFIEKLKK